MNEEEAIHLVRDAIRAGIFNDLGSGSNVDVKVLRLDGSVTYLRNYETPNEVAPLRALIKRPAHRIFPKGTTVITAETRTKTG
jgi:20S proteasome subunit beta 2